MVEERPRKAKARRSRPVESAPSVDVAYNLTNEMGDGDDAPRRRR